MVRPIASLGCVLMAGALMFGCADDGGTAPACDDAGTQRKITELLGTYNGQIVLDLFGTPIPAKTMMTVTQTACNVDVTVTESSFGNCGETFVGRLTYASSNENWVGMIEAVPTDAKPTETEAELVVSPLSIGRVDVLIRILETTEQLCEGRTLEGELKI